MTRIAWTLVAVACVACGGQTVSGASPAADAGSPDAAPTGLDAAASDAGTLPEAGGSDGGAPSAEDRFCQAAASRAACPNGAVECREHDKCRFARNTSAAAFDVFVKCWGAPACGGEDVCLAQAGEVAGGPSAKDYVSACFAKLSECGRGAFDDDYCSALVYAYVGAGAAATACLSRSCAEQPACLEAVERSFMKSGCSGDAGR